MNLKPIARDSHPLDTISADIQAELDILRAFGANQMPSKHKEIELLTKAFKDIEGNYLIIRTLVRIQYLYTI